MEINLINDNLQHGEKTFLYSLREGSFNRAEYNKLVKLVYDINGQNISKEVKLEISCKLWEIAFFVVQYLSANDNPNVIYLISNITEDEICILSENVYLMANFLTYNKPMNLGQFYI
jgi:hypothetical protein